VEREYCSQLWSLMEDFMNPVRDETIVGRREFSLLFPSYLPHMYETHCILLRKLEDRLNKWKHGGVIGDVFAKFTESHDVRIILKTNIKSILVHRNIMLSFIVLSTCTFVKSLIMSVPQIYQVFKSKCQ